MLVENCFDPFEITKNEYICLTVTVLLNMASFYDNFTQYKDKIFHKYLYQAYYLELIFGWTCALCAYMLSMELSVLVWIRAVVFPPILFYLS